MKYISPGVTADALRSLPLFSGLVERDVARVLEKAVEVELTRGEVLCRDGEDLCFSSCSK